MMAWKDNSPLKSKQNTILPQEEKSAGKYLFTNQRIIFVGNGVIEKLRVKFEISYSEIQSVTPYRVVFFSTGILIRMKNGDSYRLSLRKRDQYIAMIQNYMEGTA